MKKLEEVIDYVKDGSVLIIRKSDLESESYYSYIMKYDGGIFEDVISAEINEVISEIPNIREQLNIGYSCRVLYSIENKQYHSSVIKPIENSGYKKLSLDQLVQDFQVSNEDFLESIIALDTKIVNTNSNKVVQKNMKKELAS